MIYDLLQLPGVGAWSALLGAIHVGPVQFDEPSRLWLIPVLGALTVWLARRSIAGLGTGTRWAALLARLLVITLLAGALAEPQWRRESRNVATTVIFDASLSIPPGTQSAVARYIEDAARAGREGDLVRAEDRLGVVTTAREAIVQSLAQARTSTVERLHGGELDGTDLSAALRLAIATLPRDAGNRILLVSDGNETKGSLLQAADAAKAAGVPIDILPLPFKIDEEVLVDRVLAPATARMGETVGVRVVLQSTGPAGGRLNLLMNGEPVDLDPDSAALGEVVELRAGLNVFTVPVKTARAGPQRFEAVFEPEVSGGAARGDTRVENNRAAGVTFVASEGRVLIIAETPEEVGPLEEALTRARIATEVVTAERAPTGLTEWNAYDAVILANQASYGFTAAQQEEMKQYVRDSGGGLIMVGGPESFGAGGWMGSPLEDALPIRLDPPQKRQMPRGALVVLTHSIEMPEGVYYGKKTAEAAANALSRLDLIGLVEFRGFGAEGAEWVLPLREVGDGTAVKRAINNLAFGDMQDFAPSFRLALEGLSNAPAGQRHMIVISDGDPTPPSRAMLQRFRDAKITVSTVCVFPHTPNDATTLRAISQFVGGRHYDVASQTAMAQLPQIFIKEAQTVRRSLIWEGTPFSPAVQAGASEPMRGIPTPVPGIGGYVVAADREGLSLVTMRGKENDPILAQWQFGLGKVVTFTSDATTRWAGAWTQWASFGQFWEQHVRWAMRPTGNANLRVNTETRGDETVVTVDALDAAGERVNFAQFRGRLARPDGQGEDVEFRQTAPGRYEARVRSEQAGAYVLSMRYAASAPEGAPEGTPAVEGSAQAAITRPFADEFRALEDNTALLEQVRALTGGRVLGPDPARAELFSREGLTMPVRTTPIWLFVACCGIAVFLVDVGVRRVRLDPALVAAAVRRVVSPARSKKAGEIGTLQAAREKARAKLDERAGGGGGAARGAGDGASAEPATTPEAVRASAGVKFEAGKEYTPAGGAGGGVVTPASSPEGMKSRLEAPKAEPGQGAAPKGDGDALSRLRQAKRRAQDEMGE